MRVTLSQALEQAAIILRAKLVPFLHGSPAIGKSSVAVQLAQMFNLYLIDLRCSQLDPTDMNGFPRLTDTRAGYVPMDTFPIEGDPIPEGYNGWLLFLDEMNSASMSVQAASYKLVLDRMVGKYKLHKNVAIMAAGNLETDGAIVNPMSTAMQSRLIHLEVETDTQSWLSWANKKGIDTRITSYIEWRKDKLYNFSPEHTDKTYASPRTWEFMDKILGVAQVVDRSLMPTIFGTIGEGTGREFHAFCQIRDRLPKMANIESEPHKVPVPDEPSVQYAIIGAIADYTTESNCAAMKDYVKRMPAEFQVMCVRMMVQRNKKLLSNTAIQDWIAETAAEVI